MQALPELPPLAPARPCRPIAPACRDLVAFGYDPSATAFAARGSVAPKDGLGSRGSLDGPDVTCGAS